MIRRKLNLPLFAITAMATYVAASVVAYNGANVGSSDELPRVDFQSPVSILYQSKHICSGIILNKRWIITSANCIEKHFKDTELLISYGSVLRNDANRTKVGSEKIVVHPKFDAVTLVNNVALIKTKSDIIFNYNVEAAKLPTKNTLEDEKVYAVGWRIEKDPSKEYDDFIYYETTVMALDLCWDRIDDVEEAEGIRIPDEVVCTYGPDESKGTLPLLDNGSALFVQGTNEFIGIVSWYKSNLPKIYTRVYSMLPWIESVVNGNE